MIKLRLSFCVALILVAGTAAAKNFVQKERHAVPATVAPNGTVAIVNAHGSVIVVGSDDPGISIIVEKVVTAADEAGHAEAMRLVQPQVVGTDQVRVIKTVVVGPSRTRWHAVVNYTVRLPRTVSLKVSSISAETIRVSDMRGTVSVTSTSGAVTLERVTGGVMVDTVNGNITLHAPARVIANATLLSVNGTIHVHVPTDANFNWEGEVLQGDAKTTFVPRVQFHGNRFRGTINNASGPLLKTQSLGGNVYVLRSGTAPEAAQSIRSLGAVIGPISRPRVVERLFEYKTMLGNIDIQDVEGSIDLYTGAGEIRLGTVLGFCTVFTSGGPLNLGDIRGPLKARTDGGDVVVQSARQGGSITTGGGIIRLHSAGGPIRLISGGGDIVVRRTTAPITAETRSGDISITLDASTRSERLQAKTAKGNVLLSVPVRFAADIEAIVVTSDPNLHQIRSELGNLSFQREQMAGGKTRIRATGKINGGGERVDLFAEDGGIQITASPR